jgi:hypothetical protein
VCRRQLIDTQAAQLHSIETELDSIKIEMENEHIRMDGSTQIRILKQALIHLTSQSKSLEIQLGIYSTTLANIKRKHIH